MSSQTGSLAGGIVPFDLNSQSGVMQLLAAVRASDLSPVQKNELRDLVFLYSNGGGDASVRIALLQKLDTYKLTPVTKTPVVKAAPVVIRPFGNSRPAPAFSPVSVRTAVATTAPLVKPKVAPVVAAEPALVPVERQPAPVTVPQPEVVPTPVPAPVAAPVPEVVSAQVPANPMAQPAVPAPEVVMPAPASVPVPPPAPVVAAPTNHLERIRVIKQMVNQKVGNPVNLVDIDNAVGREYMMALLEAMKKVGGGMSGEIEVAMSRLEEAFARVEQTVAAHEGIVRASAPQTVVTEPSPVPVPAPAPAPQYVPPPVEPPRFESPPQSVPVATSPEIRTPAPAPFKAASLADDTERLLTPNDLPDPATLSTGTEVGDPLHTKEVDTGLDQLLLEWAIFKKSGLFGTGPKGIMHPLFKELAPLTIPLILAGRYEGATQEIRQSITDYMNGWRYEQGLVYDQEETFEHYLRRVIRHIIDLQKRRTSA